MHTKQEVWRTTMTTKNFDATPTPSEPISLEQISKENGKDAWNENEAKIEYKEFNKHDLIESMQSDHDNKLTSRND